MTFLKRDLLTLRGLTTEQVEAAICEKDGEHYQDHHDWAQQCHSVSLEIVRSGLFEQARVSRGSCRGVGGQHSWVTLGDDCYDLKAPILDATLWSYDDTAPVLWKSEGLTGSTYQARHLPHGYGLIWDYGRPTPGGGEIIEIDTAGLSGSAVTFLKMLGPLDRQGWGHLVHGPVQGWPAQEILERLAADQRLAALIPIDILGMVTDLNPSNLYLAKNEEVELDV